MYTIRIYQPSDQEGMERCIIELQDFERSLEPDCVEGITIATRYLRDMLDECQAKMGQIFVMEFQGHVIGFVNVRMEHDWDSYLSSITSYAYVSDLVVLPAHRAQGIATVLMHTAETYAKARGATLMKIEVLARNEQARRLYQKEGFRDYDLVMLKQLDEH
jgi:ribosomal protein S18 acetylase RimI-like enzyme